MGAAFFETESERLFIELCNSSDEVLVDASIMEQRGFATGTLGSTSPGATTAYFGHLNELSVKMESFIDVATDAYGLTDKASSVINGVRVSVFNILPGLAYEVHEEELRVDVALKKTDRAFNALCKGKEAIHKDRALYFAERRNLDACVRELETLGNTPYWPFLAPALRDQMMAVYETISPSETRRDSEVDTVESTELKASPNQESVPDPRQFRAVRNLGYTIIHRKRPAN